MDLYGKCAQVTLTTDNCAQEARILSNDLTNEATAAASAHNHVNQISSGNSAQNNLTNTNIAAMSSQSEADAAVSNANESVVNRIGSTQQGQGFFNNNKFEPFPSTFLFRFHNGRKKYPCPKIPLLRNEDYYVEKISWRLKNSLTPVIRLPPKHCA